ncbi:RagB/SusD family nutrient uptake outer membrane protein [Butyricimonas paravirosa]
MKRVIKYGLWCFLLLLASCQDFLEPKSQSEYVPKLVQSLQELLIGRVYMGPNDGALTQMLCFLDDDVAVRSDLSGFNVTNESDFYQVQLAYSWSDQMPLRLSGYNVYEVIYQKIVGCNAVLDYMDYVSGSQEEKDYVAAQALTMRAFYYYYLVNMYGKPYNADKNALGVPLKVSSNLSTDDVPRSTVKEIYDQMEKDLLEAERLFERLPVEKQFMREGLVNLPMVQLLLSRMYLYMENWQEALNYGEKVIEDYSISLIDLKNESEKTEEDGVPVTFYSWENPEVIFLFGDVYPANKFALSEVSYRNTDGYYSFKKIAIASEPLLELYKEGDLRTSAYLRQEVEMGEDWVPTFYTLIVGKIEIDNGQLQSGRAWGGALRASEAYLNVAEAAAMLYKMQGEASYLTKAKDLMDELREKRIDSYSYQKVDITDAEELITFVREERRRELCFESHRWFDLRRYGMNELIHVWYDNAGARVEYKLEKNDPGFTLLIPQEAFSLNHSLVQNEKRGK